MSVLQGARHASASRVAWRGATEVAEFAKSLLGVDSTHSATPRAIHVCSTVVGEDGMRRVIKIGPHSPKSMTDLFMLNLCRAHADVILTSGSILRSEPELTHKFCGPLPMQRVFSDYRAQVLGKTQPLRTVVLSRGANLPFSHPLWLDSEDCWLWTGSQTPSLQLPPHVRLVSSADTMKSLACQIIADGKTLSIETGPTVTSQFYGTDESIVSELWMSTFWGPAPDQGLCTDLALPKDSILFKSLTSTQPPTLVNEPSGTWAFQCFRVEPK
mmetsp:Transcript_422/g.748  ORF Transcript_422/g.748 Transcript_422/m.748 type:complete len:271 (+) Transcript_422:113-925(+)